jgi:PAS domain S-box-containing protein
MKKSIMKKSMVRPEDAAALRKQAEARLKRRSPVDGGRKTEDDTARLVHELQVHQIELQMQNEELQQARAQAEALLARYTELYDFAPVGYLTLDPGGVIRQMNLTGARLLGVERSRLVNRRFGLFVVESDRNAFSDFLQKVFASQAEECCEVTLWQEGLQSLVVRMECTRSTDGRDCLAAMLDVTGHRQAEVQAQTAQAETQRLLLLSEQSRRALLSVLEDQKRAEEALKESEEKFRLFFEDLVIGLYRTTPDGRFLMANPALVRMLGYASFEELAELNLEAGGGFEPGYSREDFKKRLERDGNIIGLEAVWVRRDGTLLFFRENARVVRDAAGAVAYYEGAVEDITDRKRGEQALVASEARFRAVFETARDCIFIKDREGRYTMINAAAAQLFGRSPQTAFGATDRDLFGEAAALHIAEQDRVVLAGEIVEALEDRPISGIVHNLHIIKVPLRDSEGKIIGLCGISRDVTERNLDQITIKQSEERYRSLFENAIIGIYRADSADRLIMANPTLVHMLGYDSFKELQKAALEETGFQPILSVALHNMELREKGRVIGLEGIWHRRDGTPLHIRQSVVALSGLDGRLESFEGTIEDITQLKLLEERFLQAQKMEALGRLAGGVAHDFNNVLMAMMSYNDLLLRALGEEDPIRLFALEIQKAVQRATDLTGQLLAFSRKQVLQLRPIRINAVVKDTILMIRRVVREDVEISIRLMSDTGTILADANQIAQVLMNLAVNARDAMPQGGVITIETKNIRVPHSLTADPDIVPPGDYILLQIRDTGVGMSDEVKAHLFEPFFTTKEEGKGTGLGLSTVFGIVQQCKGHIQVESRPGKGTTFKLFFPRNDARPSAVEIRPASLELPRGSETVLLVEDEAAVRTVTREIMAMQGYAVLEAVNGDEALRAVREHSSPIHLLISDVVMPMMSGVELARQLIALRPSLKVIFMSGYMGDEISRNGGDAPEFTFLQKPFSPEVLINTVREVLDRV